MAAHVLVSNGHVGSDVDACEGNTDLSPELTACYAVLLVADSEGLP